MGKASKRKAITRRRNAAQRVMLRPAKPNKVLCVISFAMLLLQSASQIALHMRYEDYDKTAVLFRKVLAALDPSKPENGYFSEAAKEAAYWINRENTAGRLKIALRSQYLRDEPSAFMGTDHLDGEPTILVSLRHMWWFVRYNQGLPEGEFNEIVKNNLLAALAHERVHLGHGTDLPIVEHEARAHGVVSLGVVRPMRERGAVFSPEVLQIDDVLRQCGDDYWSECFREFIRLKYFAGRS